MNKKLPVDPKVKDEALATYIFEQMIDEAKSLRKICQELETKPSTISLWLRKDFRDQYQDAQEERAERLADDLMEETNVELTGDRGDNALIQKARLRVETAKWISSKLKPRKFGDRLQHAGDSDQPITIKIIDYSNTTLGEQK